MYHNSGGRLTRPHPVPVYSNAALVGDLSEREGYDFEQLRSITKVLVRVDYLLPQSSANLLYRRVQMATLLHTAGYELDEWL